MRVIARSGTATCDGDGADYECECATERAASEMAKHRGDHNADAGRSLVSACNRAMLVTIVAFAHKAPALTFLLAIIFLSLVVTLPLQAVLARLLTGAGLALPMVIAQAVGIAFAVLAARRFWPAERRAPVEIPTRAHRTLVVASLLAGVSLQFPLSALGGVVQEYFPLAKKQLTLMYELVYPTGVIKSLVATVGIGCVVPICEEWLYRRTILSRLLTHFGEGTAVAVSALVFGLAHFMPHAIVAATFAGVVLGWLYLRVGFSAAIAFHMGVNLTPFLVRPDWVPIAGFNLLEESSDMPTQLWLVGLLVGGLVLFFIFRGRVSGQNDARGPSETSDLV